MPRTQFVAHEDRQIVLMDFTHIRELDQALEAIEEARRFVAAQPRMKKLLTLVDVTDSVVDDAKDWLVRQHVPPASVPDILR
jgi:hypothetical protein